MNIAFMTHKAHPQMHPDDALAAKELERMGHNVTAQIWNEKFHQDYNLLILRSSWDYHFMPQAFSKWIQSLKTKTLNDPSVILWNMNKRYLLDLESLGIPIVPTLFLKQFNPHEVYELAAINRWSQVILKPEVSASSEQTHLLDLSQIKNFHYTLDHHRGRTLLQPFLEEIKTKGELSLVFFSNGSEAILSHCYKKTPKPDDFRVQLEFGGSALLTPAPATALRVAHQCIAFLKNTFKHSSWLYARIDLMPHQDQWLVSEMELIEPALSFYLDPHSPKLFAESVRSHLNEGN